ncbi:hypothetical protein DMH04_19680 [Kibdelosporangium aridum]|uniref:Uncharacterized protein n=2 Tax=Kibdelosporangium aridum TaxID=2030 RepID=A0A428Z9N1_KIBAR|nr:hypothetical protein DMH04_19680 [Kibdelosporangium aridum]
MSMQVRVDFNPHDAVPEVLCLIVPAPTGVVYENRCGGQACLQNSLEGYLVVVGRATPFVDFFAKFDGRPPQRWSPDDLDHLQRLIREKVVYFVAEIEFESRVLLSLDFDRLDDLTEAWIPVRAGDQAAVLVFANSA